MSERNKSIALVGALLIALATTGTLLIVVISGDTGDLERTLLYVTGFAIPTVAALLAAAGIRAELSTKLDEVRANTNGKLDKLAGENDRLRSELARIELERGINAAVKREREQ